MDEARTASIPKTTHRRSGPLGLGIAAVAAAASTAVQLLLDPYIGDSLIFSTYFAAVVVAAAYGGWWPGVLAIVLCVVSADWFFIAPRYTLKIPFDESGVWISIATFSAVGLILSGISEVLHRSRARAHSIAEERAAALEAEAAQREVLRVTLGSIGDAVIASDARGRVSYLNATAEQLIGWTSEEAIGRPLKDVFHIINEQSRQPVEDPCERVLRTGRVVGLGNHTVLIAKDGTERPIDDSAAPIRGRQENIEGVVLVFRDATHARRAQETNERLAAIVEHSFDAIVGKRLDGTITSWNSGAERLYGYSAEEAIGRPISMVVPPEKRAELETVMDRLRRGQEIDHLETERVRKDGSRVDVSLTISPIKNSYGEVIGASKIARDITEQRRTREALEHSEERAQFLSEASKSIAALVDVESSMHQLARLCVPRFADWCVFYLMDDQLKIRAIARAHRDPQQQPILSELTARYVHELQGPSVLSRVLRSGEPEYLPDVSASFFQSTAEDARHGELIQQLAPCSMIVLPLASRARTIGAIALARGESRPGFAADEFELAQELGRRASTAIDNSRLYDELRKADRQKDDFLAMLAHELRNPLAAIDYAVQLSKISPEQAASASEIIHRQVRQLARLIDDLLDISRITRDKIELQKEVVDAATLVNRAAGTARPTIEEHQHQLIVQIAPEDMPLFADPTRIEQILVNLLTNAAKYTPAGGRITLEAFPQNDQLLFKVKDTGVGIPTEMLPRVFELFTQVNPAIDRTKGGLGIGLTVVRRLAEMHGGTVSATSEGLGKGSEFTVRLPQNKDVVTKGAEARPIAGVRPGLRVLVVEDNIDTARSVALLLENANCQTKIVHDGLAALESVEGFNPEVVLLDIGLPGLDGYEVARRLRAAPEYARVRLIAISGYGQAQDRERSKDAGFDHHLVKPVEIDSLLAILAEKPVST
jgi:PAS domain S-box-containing protein